MVPMNLQEEASPFHRLTSKPKVRQERAGQRIEPGFVAEPLSP